MELLDTHRLMALESESAKQKKMHAWRMIDFAKLKEIKGILPRPRYRGNPGQRWTGRTCAGSTLKKGALRAVIFGIIVKNDRVEKNRGQRGIECVALNLSAENYRPVVVPIFVR